MTYDCIVIGGGPAGILSAIQIKRAGFEVILIEKDEISGLLRNAKCVENYLGFPGGISGKKLVEIFKKQLKDLGINIKKEEVLKVTGKKTFLLKTAKNTYKARSIVLATGTVPKSANLKGEKGLIGKRIFFHPDDLPHLQKGKHILLLGGGDAAFDYAVNLSDSGHVPTIIAPRGIKCLPLLQTEAKERSIPIFEKVSPQTVFSDGKSIELICKKGKFTADYLLIAVGREPQVLRCPKAQGVFLAGDVHTGIYRQIHIATGDALQAAMNVTKYLQNS